MEPSQTENNLASPTDLSQDWGLKCKCDYYLMLLGDNLSNQNFP